MNTAQERLQRFVQRRELVLSAFARLSAQAIYHRDLPRLMKAQKQCDRLLERLITGYSA